MYPQNLSENNANTEAASLATSHEMEWRMTQYFGAPQDYSGLIVRCLIIISFIKLSKHWNKTWL